jgi:hypothetical protein
MIFKPCRPTWLNGWIGMKGNTHPKLAKVGARKSARGLGNLVRPFLAG